MILFFSGFLFFQEILLWILLIQSKKSRTKEEQFEEDNLQMQYLKEFKDRKERKKLYKNV